MALEKSSFNRGARDFTQPITQSPTPAGFGDGLISRPYPHILVRININYYLRTFLLAWYLFFVTVHAVLDPRKDVSSHSAH